MLDIQVKCIPLKSFPCFIGEAWVQKDPEKLNSKDNSESVLLSAVKVKGVPWILHPFFISICGAAKPHPRLCEDRGIPRLSKGEWRRSLPKSSWQRKEGLGSKVAQPGIVWGKEAALLPSCSKDANACLDPARGLGARDKNQQSVTSAFCDCCPKNHRGTFGCFSELGWRALRGFLEGRQRLCALLLSPPHNGFLGFAI